MTQDTEETRVIFRRFRAKPREVIAFFPDIPETGLCVQSYMHIGQHGEATYPHTGTIPADLSEPDVAALKRELERIGYKLKVVKRKSPNREQPTGRYAPDMSAVCYCGHTLGNHLAEGPVSSRDCCEPGCGCHGFERGE